MAGFKVITEAIAQFYIPKTTENDPLLISDATFRRYWSDGLTPQGIATAKAWATATEKRFFHWFLEFPDIIARGGFDCILGNPPYLGGQALSGTYGHSFCGFVKWEYTPTGLSDLVAFFLRRIFTLLRHNGFTSFITTNSIKDGDIRKDGLEQVIANGGEICMAVRGIKWPGRANLVVSLVALRNGAFTGKRLLDGKEVSVIGAFLDSELEQNEPVSLESEGRHLLVGTHYLGDGFVLSGSEANRIRECDPDSELILAPLLNGDELNNIPDQQSGRWIICFWDWTQARAGQHGAAYEIVESLVKPARQLSTEKRLRERWWQFKRPYTEIHAKTQSLKQAFTVALTTKHMSFSAISPNVICTHALAVFTTDRWDLFAVVQSTLHEIWARKYSGALKQDLRYSPSKCFETFAFPVGIWQTANSDLSALGERYHGHRRSLMLSLWLGLTDIYNLFHARSLSPAMVAKVSKKSADEAARGYEGLLDLRRLHVQLDLAIRDAYGWQDMPLDHDFYEVETLAENDRVRYTISPTARKEVLRRLLTLNHQRAAEEEEKRKAAPKPAKGKRGEKALPSDSQPALSFDES
jgi:hypothetical protein